MLIQNCGLTQISQVNGFWIWNPDDIVEVLMIVFWIDLHVKISCQSKQSNSQSVKKLIYQLSQSSGIIGAMLHWSILYENGNAYIIFG